MPPAVLEVGTRIDPAVLPAAALNVVVGLEEAAQFLRVPPNHALELVKLRQIPALRSGETHFIRFGDLVEYHRERERRREKSRSSSLSRMFGTLYKEGYYDNGQEFPESAGDSR